MSLFRLPPKILLHVLSYLGFEFFAISRIWYDLAWRILIQNLQFTARSLEQSTENEAVPKRSTPYIVIIELSLGVDDEFSQSLPTDDLREASGNVGDIHGSPVQLDSSLAKLATMLPRCSAMRSLIIRARGQSSGLRLDRLVGVLSPAHLTSLELDAAGCHLKSLYNSNIHLCRTITSILPYLRRLRCRMEEIRESLLERPPRNMALEEVIIKLSISQFV